MLPSIIKLTEQIEVARNKIKKIQSKCKHPFSELQKRYGANIGGYDGPNFDKYWADFKCYRCGKYWRCDKGDDGYDRNAIVVKEFTEINDD